MRKLFWIEYDLPVLPLATIVMKTWTISSFISFQYNSFLIICSRIYLIFLCVHPNLTYGKSNIILCMLDWKYVFIVSSFYHFVLFKKKMKEKKNDFPALQTLLIKIVFLFIRLKVYFISELAEFNWKDRQQVFDRCFIFYLYKW